MFLGIEEDAVGEDVGEDVELDLVAGEFGGIEDLAGVRVGGQKLVVEPADDVVVERLAVGLGGFLELLGRAGIKALHELGADVGAFGEELLVVAVELVDEAFLAGLDVFFERFGNGRIGRFVHGCDCRARGERLEEGGEEGFGGEGAVAVFTASQETV